MNKGCSVKTLEECREKRNTLYYPNGKPEGTGLYEHIQHPCYYKFNCICEWAIYKEMTSW